MSTAGWSRLLSSWLITWVIFLSQAGQVVIFQRSVTFWILLWKFKWVEWKSLGLGIEQASPTAWKLSSFVDFTSLKDFEWMQWWTWGQIHWDDVTKMEKVVPRGHFTLFCIYTKTSPLEGLFEFWPSPSKKNCWKINTLQSSLSSLRLKAYFAIWLIR